LQQPVYVTPRQYRILELLVKGVNQLHDIARELGVKQEDLMRDLAELEAKN